MKVIHCFRSPVGGLFRHVRDLIALQHQQGIEVGIICDSQTGGDQAERILQELEPLCALGVYRLPIQRAPGISDYLTSRRATAICLKISPDIIHGHGAKGGAYSRLLARKCSAHSIYTPHGGALHYNPLSALGYIYFALERLLRPNTDAMIFESQFSALAYEKKIGPITCQHKVIHNGLAASEFSQSDHSKHEYDFLFLGEFRKLKGLDVFVDALALLQEEGPVTAMIAGAGSDSASLLRQIRKLKLENFITVSEPVFPASDAFSKAKCLVVPSRAESLPYIVLEASAAGVPLIATNVGGIAEIYGPYADRLIEANNATALADSMRDVISNPRDASAAASDLQERVRSSFRIELMERDINSFYSDVLAHNIG
jgi:glycosyltransferase involved in cell wall biosynthesis